MRRFTGSLTTSAHSQRQESTQNCICFSSSGAGYKITLANVGGKRVHGWLSVPKGKGPFPAILTVPEAACLAWGYLTWCTPIWAPCR